MPHSNRTDEEILDRAADDVSGGYWRAFGKRFKDIKPTFDAAYDRLSNQGKPGLFIAKTAGVGIGAVVMADGVYHIVAGSDEQVEDMFLHNETSRNYVRMFTGACEVLGGAMMAYLAATKGPVR
jgi:hypothetical protein